MRRSQLYFVLQFPFDMRHGRPATKALTRSMRQEEEGKENSVRPPKSIHRSIRRRCFSARTQPDVHLIIITPNESHSASSSPFVLMDFSAKFESRSNPSLPRPVAMQVPRLLETLFRDTRGSPLAPLYTFKSV